MTLHNPASLATFFDRTEDASLCTCDRKKIYFVGHIQNIGALVVVDLAMGRVIGASDNTGAFLQVDIAAVIGAKLTDLAPELACKILRFKDQTAILQAAVDFSL